MILRQNSSEMKNECALQFSDLTKMRRGYNFDLSTWISNKLLLLKDVILKAGVFLSTTKTVTLNVKKLGLW